MASTSRPAIPRKMPATTRNELELAIAQFMLTNP